MYFQLGQLREMFCFVFCFWKVLRQRKGWVCTNCSFNYFEKQEHLRADEFINMVQQSCPWYWS